jgi:hypothetical protein
MAASVFDKLVDDNIFSDPTHLAGRYADLTVHILSTALRYDGSLHRPLLQDLQDRLQHELVPKLKSSTTSSLDTLFQNIAKYRAECARSALVLDSALRIKVHLYPNIAIPHRQNATAASVRLCSLPSEWAAAVESVIDSQLDKDDNQTAFF